MNLSIYAYDCVFVWLDIFMGAKFVDFSSYDGNGKHIPYVKTKLCMHNLLLFDRETESKR